MKKHGLLVKLLVVSLVLLLLGVACSTTATTGNGSPATAIEVEDSPGAQVQVNITGQESTRQPRFKPTVQPTATLEFPLENEVDNIVFLGTSKVKIVDIMPMCAKGRILDPPEKIIFYGGFPEKNREPCPLNRGVSHSLEVKLEYLAGPAQGKVTYLTNYSITYEEASPYVGFTCEIGFLWKSKNDARDMCKPPEN